MRVPVGGATCLGVGRPGSGALPPPTAHPLGWLLGPTTGWLWVRGGAVVGTRHQRHSARSFELALRAVGAAQGRSGGGRLLPGCGASGVGRSPTPDCPPSGRAAGAHYPLAVGAGGMQAWGPVTNPTARALASWICALWGGMRVPWGAPLAWVWGVQGRALSQPRLPALWAACRGPLPTGCGCGGVQAWGPVTNPTARALSSWLCALWGRHEGARGGAPPAWVWGVRGRALSHPRLPALLAGCWGPLPTGCGCGGMQAWGPVTNPTARALASWLCALLGRHEGARGGRLLPGCGASRVGRFPTPDCPPSGRPAGAHYPLAVGAGGCGRGDPSPTPQRALFRAGFARCRGGTRAPRVWGASWLGVGRPGSGALPPPTARPLGGLPGPTTHWLWVQGGCGRGDPSPTQQRALLRAGFARFGGRMRLPGGAPPAWVWGVRGRALSHPRLPSLWAGCQGPLPTGCGCGGVRAWGPVSNPTARALSSLLCALWGWHVGAWGGGASCLRVGRLRLGALPAPTARPLGGLPGPTTHWLWVRGGAGVGTRHQPHSARSFELALHTVGAARGRPGGGRLLPRYGASRVGRSPTPDCPPSGRADGAHYPLAVDAGGRGRGDPSPTPQPALFRAGFARCGGGMRMPGGGGASCLGVGRPGSGALPPPTARPLGGLPGCRACACPAWPGRAGRPPGRVLVRLTFPLAFLASLFACSAPSGLGLPCLWLLLVFFFVALPLLPLAAPPLCPALRVFRPRVPWALASCPPPFPPPPVRLVVSCFACFSAWGALGLGVLLPPPLPFFLLAFRLPLASAPPPPLFFSLSSCASAVCVLGCRAVCSLSCPFVVLCASSVLFLVAGVVGSWCRCLLLGVCWWLWLPGVVVWWCVSALVPVSGLAVAGRPPCGVPFP